jgi:hypothetical protein
VTQSVNSGAIFTASHSGRSHVLDFSDSQQAIMTDAFDLVIDAPTTRATLVFRGSVRHADAATAVRTCLALPRRVRSLRIDMREVESLTSDAKQPILALIHAWRRVRRARVTVLPDERAIEASGWRTPSDPVRSKETVDADGSDPALTAAFL